MFSFKKPNTIGTVSKTIKRLLKILGIIFALLVVIIVGIVLFIQSAANDTITGDDGVAAGYNTRINYTQPLEKKYSELGPYSTTHERQKSDDPSVGEYHIYFPNTAAEVKETYPLIVMVNGTFTPASEYLPVLEHLASWGFVVVGNEDEQSGNGVSTTTTLDYVLDSNQIPESPLFGLIATDSIGIAGHSQGGAGAINAASTSRNSNRLKSIYTASAISHFVAKNNNGDYDTAKLTIPSFFMAGTGGEDRFFISPLRAVRKNFEALSTTQPAVIARRTGVDHKDVLEYGDPYMTAWFLWTLKNDPDASQVFTGEKPELANNPDWQDVESKNLP